MKNKGKKNRKKLVARKRAVLNWKRIYFLALISGFAVFASIALALKKEHKNNRVCDQQLLKAPLAQSWQDPVFARKYSENIIQSVLDRLPKDANYISAEMNQPARQYLESVLKSDAFDRELKLILAGKEAAAKGPQLKLILVLDMHYSSLHMTQEQYSTDQQLAISSYIANGKFPLALAEGFDYELTYANMYRDLLRLAERNNFQPPPYEQFVQSMSKISDITVWHDPFVNKGFPKIIGIDHMPAVWLWHVLVELKENTNYLNYTGFEEFTNYNLAWRSQLLLANAVLAMRNSNSTEAPLVLGFFHLYSIQPLCAHWGIKLEVQSLGLENHPDAPPELRNMIQQLPKSN